MSKPPLLIVVLAAGKGVRMASATPKVLHQIAGRSLLGHVLATALGTGGDLALVAPVAEAGAAWPLTTGHERQAANDEPS